MCTTANKRPSLCCCSCSLTLEKISAKSNDLVNWSDFPIQYISGKVYFPCTKPRRPLHGSDTKLFHSIIHCFVRLTVHNYDKIIYLNGELGTRSSLVVKALRYKPDDCGSETQWGE
jgi:hypothetical protein